MQIKNILFTLMAITATVVGLYPLVFLLIDQPFELLGSKEGALLADILWNVCLYIHIVFGGIALMTGWVQFSRKLRSSYLHIHRLLGKVYVGSVLLSALGGIYIGLFAEGGLVPSIGFVSLGIIWFYTTLRAFLDAKAKNIAEHRNMMIYSYAACLTAVTLRAWLPLLIFVFQDFVVAYTIVAWWGWIPNLLVAHFVIIKKEWRYSHFKSQNQ